MLPRSINIEGQSQKSFVREFDFEEANADAKTNCWWIESRIGPTKQLSVQKWGKYFVQLQRNRSGNRWQCKIVFFWERKLTRFRCYQRSRAKSYAFWVTSKLMQKTSRSKAIRTNDGTANESLMLQS